MNTPSGVTDPQRVHGGYNYKINSHSTSSRCRFEFDTISAASATDVVLFTYLFVTPEMQ